MEFQENFLEQRRELLCHTRDILEKNFGFDGSQDVALIYDDESVLSGLLSDSYAENLEGNCGFKKILFSQEKSPELREFLLGLRAGSLVILVQSTNFRIDNFRIRLLLSNNGVKCIEHTHLSYFPDCEISTYIGSLAYRGEYYREVSDRISGLTNVCDKFEIVNRDGSCLSVEGGLEDTKRNIGIFPEKKIPACSFPIGECFTEARDFSRVSGKLLVYAYPGEDYEVVFCDDPFFIEVEESRVLPARNPGDFPVGFERIYNMIAECEGEVMLRELGFGLNPGVTRERGLRDVNAFERIAGIHVSLGKKHQIYRKKLPKKMLQRFHIDVFIDASCVVCDGEKLCWWGE